MKAQKGITLVALIITIIVLLILAVVSISAVTGNGLFDKTNSAVSTHTNSVEKENATMQNYQDYMDHYIQQYQANGVS